MKPFKTPFARAMQRKCARNDAPAINAKNASRMKPSERLDKLAFAGGAAGMSACSMRIFRVVRRAFRAFSGHDAWSCDLHSRG